MAFAMGRRTAAALVFLLLLAAAPATARARVLVGMGDQKPAMFKDPRLRWLGVRHARLVVSWDVQRSAGERAWADAWLTAARAAGVEPMVAFGHAWAGKKRKVAPTKRTFRLAFDRFRRAHPWVHVYTPWNEANHCSQPTCKTPKRAAEYYDAMREGCPRCTVTAADLVDQPNMVRWARQFARAAKHKPTLWGLHNYLDANRLRTSGLRRLLAGVEGRIWLTETGGVVRRSYYRNQIRFPTSIDHAARATSFILKLADSQPRVRRVYLYHWNSVSLTQTWDSGLIDPFGISRPAFYALARHMGRDPSRAPGQPRPLAAVEAPPPLPPPAPEEQPPPPPPEEQQPPPPPPPQDENPPPPQDPPPPPPDDPPPPDCSPLPACPPPGPGFGGR